MAYRVYYVVKREGDGWAVKRPKAERASGLFHTKPEAIEAAHRLAEGGVINIQGADGKFQKCTCRRCR